VRPHLDTVDAFERVVAAFDATVRAADLAAPVPSCPGWDVVALLHHIGGIHRWAATMVRRLSPERLARNQLDLAIPDDPAQLPDWFADGGALLAGALRDCDPEAPMWAWGADQRATFWARRQLHETAVHHADAQLAARAAPEIDAVDAVDGIDEFLDNLSHAAYFAPNVANLRGGGESLRLDASDAGIAWCITLEPDRFVWSHDGGSAAATVRARASDLLLLTYGRIDLDAAAVTLSGDRALLDRWRLNSSI
jgi:uncharacterized protein (TIGR03083 family)